MSFLFCIPFYLAEVSETLMAHVLELPYQGEEISMFILLPPFTGNGIERVLKGLSLQTIKSILDGSSLPRKVQVTFPRFQLEHTINLTNVSRV